MDDGGINGVSKIGVEANGNRGAGNRGCDVLVVECFGVTVVEEKGYGSSRRLNDCG